MYPLKHSNPPPKPNQDKPLDVSSRSAYQDMGKEAEGAEGETPRGEDGRAGGDEEEVTPMVEDSTEKEAVEEVDLNETAKKQGLMTDEEFQKILDGVNNAEENAAKMAEGPDLASEAVGSESTMNPTRGPEETTAEPEEKAEPEKVVEVEPQVPTA